MKYIFPILLLLCLLISCAGKDSQSPPPPGNKIEEVPCLDCKGKYTILIDKSFTEKQQELAILAASKWVKSTDSLNLSFIITDSPYDDATHPGYISIINLPPPEEGPIGWAEWRETAGRIRMLPGLSDTYFLTVAKHEFGHTFHLDHYEGPNEAIMHPAIWEGQDIACQDLLDYCREWNCEYKCDPTEPLSGYGASLILEAGECGVIARPENK